MTTILERLDDLIRGSLHRFVDRALASNSLILYDQDVRDMETAIDHLEEATASMYAAARANERRLVRHQEAAERMEQRLDHLEAEGVDPTSERMMVAQAEMAAMRDLIAETQIQIERQQAQYETLKLRLAETDVTAETLKDARPRLESLLTLALAYRAIEQVEMTLEALRGLGGDTEVALVADSIHQRFNEAQARLDLIRQNEDLELLVELEQVEVEDQLVERRRRLGLEPEHEIIEPSVVQETEVLPEPAPTDGDEDPGGPVPPPPESPESDQDLKDPALPPPESEQSPGDPTPPLLEPPESEPDPEGPAEDPDPDGNP